MLTNEKSLKLLKNDKVAKSVSRILSNAGQNYIKASGLEEAESVYDEKIRGFTNYDEKFKTHLSAAENLSSNGTFQKVLTRNTEINIKTAGGTGRLQIDDNEPEGGPQKNKQRDQQH